MNGYKVLASALRTTPLAMMHYGERLSSMIIVVGAITKACHWHHI